MDMRLQEADARQAGLNIVVVRTHDHRHEAPASRLLRLLAQPKLSPRMIDEVAGLLTQLTVEEIVAAICTKAEYDPLGLPPNGRCVVVLPEHAALRHKESDLARLMEWALSRNDHSEN